MGKDIPGRGNHENKITEGCEHMAGESEGSGEMTG